MARVMLRSQAPVYVIVDTEQARVRRVHVDDERLTGPDTAGGVIDLDTGQIVDQATKDRAVHIATAKAAEAEWPAWEVGAP